jgi:hypothetical protein
MKQSLLAKMAAFLVTTLILSGCVWEGYGAHRGDDHHDRDRGDQHEREHGDHGGEHDGGH